MYEPGFQEAYAIQPGQRKDLTGAEKKALNRSRGADYDLALGDNKLTSILCLEGWLPSVVLFSLVNVGAAAVAGLITAGTADSSLPVFLISVAFLQTGAIDFFSALVSRKRRRTRLRLRREGKVLPSSREEGTLSLLNNTSRMLPDLSQSVWSDVIQDMDSIAWSLAQAEQARRELDQLNTGLTPSEKARHEDVRKSLDDTIEALTKQADDLYQATLHAVETQQIAGNNNIEPNLERIEKAIGSLSQTKAQALPFLNEYTNVLEQQLVEETDVRPALPESN